jgi:hypothetical protein
LDVLLGASLTSRSQAARSWSHSRALFSRTCQCPYVNIRRRGGLAEN